LHEGLFGGDPIAVRVADTTVALRRCEAMAILVTAAPDKIGQALLATGVSARRWPMSRPW
jgi:hypothetical protein